MSCHHKKRQKYTKFNTTTLYKCKSCKLILSNKYEKSFNSKKLYQNYYRNELSGRFKFGIEHIIKTFRFFRAFKTHTIFPRGKSILDIGSGRGYMLYFLKKYYNFQKTIGTQLDKKTFRFSRFKLGLEIYQKDLFELSFKNNSFDIVSLWHVLEHLNKPGKYLKRIHKLLSHKGVIIVEVPNFNSWTRKLTGKYWLGLDLKHHLNFFTSESLCFLLKKHKYKIKTIHTFSLEYSAFISAQSIISKVTQSKHLFFHWLETDRFTSKIFLHIPLFIILMPICFLVNIILIFSKKGEVLLIIAQKK